MQSYPISIAAVFNREGTEDPICSVCFFSTVSAATDKDLIEQLILEKFLQLAHQIVGSDKDTIIKTVDRQAEEIAKAFDVQCWGQLVEYNLSIAPKHTAGG